MSLDFALTYMPLRFQLIHYDVVNKHAKGSSKLRAIFILLQRPFFTNIATNISSGFNRLINPMNLFFQGQFSWVH